MFMFFKHMRFEAKHAAGDLNERERERERERVIQMNRNAVGLRLLARFGAKSACNLGKAIPLIGAAVGFGIDSVSTKAIGKHAYRNFIENVFDAGDKLGFDLSSDEIIG